MTLGSTVYRFDISLSDSDRGVYEALTLQAACHPSETAEYLVTRVMAFCLEHEEGIAFSRGLCEPDEPALWVKDLTGRISTWIEVGLPDARRLHRATKAAERVVVYPHRDPGPHLRLLAGERIHRGDSVVLRVIDPLLVGAVVDRLDRRNVFDLSVSGDLLYLGLGERTWTGGVSEHRLRG